MEAMKGIKGRDPVLSEMQAEEAREVYRQYLALPTARELAERWGTTERVVRRAMRGEIKRFEARRGAKGV